MLHCDSHTRYIHTHCYIYRNTYVFKPTTTPFLACNLFINLDQTIAYHLQPNPNTDEIASVFFYVSKRQGKTRCAYLRYPKE